MKICTTFAVALLALVGGLSAAHAQNTVYWDTNGPIPGAGIGFGDPNDGTWGTSAFWSPDPDGDDPNPTVAWTPGDNAVFSAGNDAQDHFLEVSGTQTANSVVIEDGIVWFSSGTVDTGAGTVTVNAGAELRINSSLRLNSGGKVVLNGGTLLQYNPLSAGSVISALKGLEINGVGYVGYNDFSDTNNFVSIYSGVITGTGGTVDNGGAGTLIKVGPDQLGIGATTVSGVSSQSLFTFAKLVVQEGTYRARHQTFDSTVKETVFGAVPLTELPDAITLNGGGFGSNATVTLHANRGITIGPNGGYFDTGPGAGINIPGPLSGSGTLTMGGPTGSTTFSLSHSNNANSFTGNLIANRGILRLDSSLTTPNFSGISPAAGVAGTVQVQSGMTLTAGSDDQDSSYVGRVTGAGSFTKVGNGTFTMDSLAEWTNTGSVNINAGTIKFGTSAAGFSSAAAITIAAVGKLDMNGINDTFGSLAGPAGGVVDMIGVAAIPGNLTLAAASGTFVFDGTITGGGNLTKSAASTQTLGGNNALGTVAVSGGKLLLNGINTTGAVTVGGTGTLGGTGSVSDVVTVNTGGHIAPGSSGIESFDVGGLTLEAGSILDFELAGPGTSDLINVLNSGGLTINGGTLNLTDVGGLAAGSYTLIDYAGTLNGSVNNLTIGTTPAGFNYNLMDDGSVIKLDVTGASAVLIGDYNDDGVVNAADYVVWRDNLGAATLANNRDPANVGNVDSNDYDSWRENFGATAGAGSGGSAAIPEPASVVLAGLAAIGLLVLRRRTR